MKEDVAQGIGWSRRSLIHEFTVEKNDEQTQEVSMNEYVFIIIKDKGNKHNATIKLKIYQHQSPAGQNEQRSS